MNRKIQLAWGVTIFAIACLILFQAFWLYSTLELKKEDYRNQINVILTNVVETGFEEFSVTERPQLMNNPGFSVDRSRRQIKFKNDTTQIVSYDSDCSYTGLIRKVCYDLMKDRVNENLRRLDSICKLFLNNKGITEKYVLELIDTKNGVLLATTEEKTSPLKRNITSNIMELGLTSHHGLIAHFGVPGKTFFVQMTGVLVSSLLLLVLLVSCLIYQLKTMRFQSNLSRMREEFMSNMVHELKSPLAAMQNGLVAVKSYGIDNLTSEQFNMMENMHDRINHLSNFVYKLLIVWKQGFAISWNRLNLRNTIDSLVKQFDSVFAGKNVLIEVDYQLSVDVIEADDIHFPNAISNLIENAIKYSGDAPRIEIQCREEGRTLVVSVKDHGIGIPERYIDKIFERYYRVHGGKAASVHGFGIGLSYVKQVVEAHEGVIRVESERGVGTIFTIMIPLVKEEDN